MRLPAAIAGAGLAAFVVLLTGCGRQHPGASEAASAKAAPQVAAAPGAALTQGPTLKAVRDRGRLLCGVSDSVPGFASRDVLGQWRGFDIDFCRAVAAAVLGDARRVSIEALDSKSRYSMLQAGKVDLIARAGWTYSADTGLGLSFVGASYYDGPGFLVGKALKSRTIDELAGIKVCVQAGTVNASGLAEHFQAMAEARRPIYKAFDTADEALDAYRTGVCQALSGDLSILSSQRSQLRDPDKHFFVRDVRTIEPEGPVVRQDDSQWADIVGWTLRAMVLAEDIGVTSKSVNNDRANPARPEIQRLLKGDGYGQMLLLREDWAFQVLRQVGAYNEVFDRNLGSETPLKMDRGQNALWDANPAGLLSAPPMR